MINYDQHIKIHYPFCGCKYNPYNIYIADIMCKKTRKYTKKKFFHKDNLNKYLDSIGQHYSVCIHKNTSNDLLNGGVIFLSKNWEAMEKNFQENEEIKFIKFYDILELKNILDSIQEHYNFTPIKDFVNLYEKQLEKNIEYKILLCKEKYTDIYSFPKGKRKLEETSLECSIREFVEETQFSLDSNLFSECIQKKKRLENGLNIPLKIRIFNCFFQIIFD